MPIIERASPAGRRNDTSFICCSITNAETRGKASCSINSVPWKVELVPKQKPQFSPHKQRFGRNVAKLRTAAGLSQEALAEASGISSRYLQSLEAGEYLPTLPTLSRLKQVLRCDWNALFEDVGS